MSENKDQEQSFTIQPHPATTNNPADLTSDPAESGGLQSSSANAYNAKQPHVPEAGIANQLEQPKSREELKALSEQLNK